MGTATPIFQPSDRLPVEVGRAAEGGYWHGTKRRRAREIPRSRAHWSGRRNRRSNLDSVMAVTSTINSAQTLVTMDLANKLRPGMINRQQVIKGGIAGLIINVVAALWAPPISRFDW